MLVTHRQLRTWSRIDAFIALNPQMRDLMVSGGLPSDRIHTIGNFLEPDPGVRMGSRAGFLYAGRLSEEKGLRVLLDAARAMPGRIRVAGSGPLAPAVEQAATSGVLEHLGARTAEALREDLQSAVALVMPSLWFEPFGLVIVEAFAAGTPVIASRIGAIPELVTDRKTGLLVNPGDPDSLAHAMKWALDNPDAMRQMGACARQAYEERYRGPTHLAALLDVYRLAGANRHG
jgi:glycosyltransferase involved in cell wall biosynthesis